MGNMKDIFKKFRNENPNVEIGFSNFCSLRPEHCVLAGSGGTHKVCMCPIHENMKLLVKGSDLVNLMKAENFPIDHFQDILLILICVNPEEECFLGQCKNCPSEETLSKNVSEVLVKNKIEKIEYKQWVTKPKTTLETFTATKQEFVVNLCTLGRTFLCHSFIADQQASVYRNVKKNLEDDESLIVCDFAENYAFIIQNSVPGFHWNNNNQATIFPIVFYYQRNDSIEHKTLIIISDCLKHDAVAVFAFLQAFNEFISQNHANIRKYVYFSDGAPQQFINVKHFANVYYHQQDFQRSAVWHFHESAHGKGPCDGDYERANTFLQSHFQNYKTIPGTQKFHSVDLQNDFKLKMKKYSSCNDFEIVSFIQSEPKRATKSKRPTKRKL